MTPTQALTKARKACLAIAGVEEKLSHGSPAWFTKKKQFAHFWNDHHGDGELCLWLYSDLEIQRALVESDPDSYFVPPYVGSKGWIGVRFTLAWTQIHALIEAAATARAATKRG